MKDAQRTRALSRISGHRGEGRYGQRFDAAREADLLAYAATLSDEVILGWRNTGPGVLRWIRTHQPRQDESTFALVLKRTGWRVELFWNGPGGWFTARLVSLWDRDGNRSYAGGFLVPFDDPTGAGAATPEGALAALAEAVLEWAT